MTCADRFRGDSVTRTDVIGYPHIPRAMIVREAATRIPVVPVTVRRPQPLPPPLRPGHTP